MLRNQNEIERRKRMTPGSKGRVVMAFRITSTRSFNDHHDPSDHNGQKPETLRCRLGGFYNPKMAKLNRQLQQ